MQMLELAALPNGAHANQICHGQLPDGWAVIPAGMELESFPFGEVTAEEVDGVMTVTGWTPGIVPEPGPEPEPPAAETTDAELAAAILKGVDDV